MAKGRRRRLKPVKLWKELPILFGVALLLALVIKTFFVQAYFDDYARGKLSRD